MTVGEQSDLQPTRYSLLSRLKDWDDQEGWRDFFETYWQLIYNVALKAGLTDAEAQEVVQETVIGVAKKIGRFKTDSAHGSFKAWLLKQAQWRIGDQFRKRLKEAATPHVGGCPPVSIAVPTDDTGLTSTIDRIPDPATSALEALWDGEWEGYLRRAALARIKLKIRPRQYQMFDLHVLQGVSVDEAARTLRVSKAQIYLAKHRVSKLLKREVKILKESLS